jgi:hypothetical protein
MKPLIDDGINQAALGCADLIPEGKFGSLERVTRQLEILALRAFDLADRVAAGEIELIDAVDIAYSAAQWAGLCEAAGDRVVQTVLHEAFRKVRATA